MVEDERTTHPHWWRWVVLALGAFLFIFSQFYRASNAVIAPRLQADLSLSAESLGLLSAVFFYVFAAAQIPLGLYLDRLGARWTMTVLNLVGACGAFVFALSNSMAMALAGRLLMGLGMAANLMGPMKLFTGWFSPREFATLSGLILAIGSLGNMLAATPLALLELAVGWRWAFAITGLLTILVTMTFFLLVRDSPGPPASPLPFSDPAATSPQTSLNRIHTLLGQREYWLISTGTFLRYGVFVAIQGLWAGPYLMEGLGLSPVQAGNVLLLLNIGYLVGAPLAGWLADRVFESPRRTVLTGMVVSLGAIFVLFMGWGEHHEGWLGLIFLVFGIFSAFGIVMYAHIKQVVPSDMTGMALTGVNLFTMLGGAIFLQGMGFILDLMDTSNGTPLENFHVLFLVALVAGLLSLFLYLFTREGCPQCQAAGRPESYGRGRLPGDREPS